MSRAVKDSLIMVGAAGSVALLVAGSDAGLPALAAAGAALALAATVAKLSESSTSRHNDTRRPPTRSDKPASPRSHTHAY